MRKFRKETILHDLFLVGIVIKGIDGLLELAGGLLLLLLKTEGIAGFVQAFFRHELAEDPTDLIATHLVQASQALSISAITFAAIYLLVHGAIKLGLFLGLWFRKPWAYPVAGILLSVFVIYQLIRLSLTHSPVLLYLTMVDIVIIALLRSEYRRLKRPAG